MSRLLQDIQRDLRQLDAQEKLRLVQQLIDELDRDPELDHVDAGESEDLEQRSVNFRGL